MKIKSIKSLGMQKTYSPEMRGRQHNYITSQSNVVHRNSHSVSYCLVAHRCLWLKAHFAPEWWASVMSDCHSDKLVRYMGVARAEGWTPTEITYAGLELPKNSKHGVQFDTINIENLTTKFTVTGDVVNQGLIGIAGIGDSMASVLEGRSTFVSLDDWVQQKTKQKVAFEAFIKLGAFKRFPGYENARATWEYYRYKYCSGTEITKLRKEIRQKLLEKEGWNEQTIESERQRQIVEYRKLYPKRRKIPDKISKWQPKPDDSIEKVMALFDDDFTLTEILAFEKKYLKYYLHSPLDLYDISGKYTIANAKKGGEQKLEVVITEIQSATSKNGKPYARVFVSDGIQNALVLVFANELILQNQDTFDVGVGVQMMVNYDDKRGTFTLMRGDYIIKLLRRGWQNAGTK